MSKIVLQAEYPYTPEQVWEALTDSDAIKQWLMDNDFKAVVGHKFQFRAKPNKHWRGVVDGEVLEVDPPSRLVYTWEGDPGKKTTVTWMLEAAGNGTRLRLLHEGFEGVGGFILSKLILGPGWKKLMNRYIPIVLSHVKTQGLRFERGKWLIPEKACHSPEGATAS
jgi:uncharacterized protein YndB with AHSA1/START domain